MKSLGQGFSSELLTHTFDPFIGLFVGILATSILQSSSTTTSLTVVLVAGGVFNVQAAIPIIIGSNLGTSITSVLVSLGYITNPLEFKRAFSTAIAHHFFNLITILIIFPIQWSTNILGILAEFLMQLFTDSGSLLLINPLKLVFKPGTAFMTELTSDSPLGMLIGAGILLIISLRCLVTTLKKMAINKIKDFFDKRILNSKLRALSLGAIVTVMVQSSSVTTSLIVPLAAAGITSLRQIFPLILGTNIGTTITAILASLVTNNEAAMTVAFAHLLFNLFGIIAIWPIRKIPIHMAETLAEWSMQSKVIPLVYIGTVFFLIPMSFIYFMS